MIDPSLRWKAAVIEPDVSGFSRCAAYRVQEYLERNDLVVKEDKRYRVTDWERLLRLERRTVRAAGKVESLATFARKASTPGSMNAITHVVGWNAACEAVGDLRAGQVRLRVLLSSPVDSAVILG